MSLCVFSAGVRFKVAFECVSLFCGIEGDCGLDFPRTVLGGMGDGSAIVILQPFIEIDGDAHVVSILRVRYEDVDIEECCHCRIGIRTLPGNWCRGDWLAQA